MLTAVALTSLACFLPPCWDLTTVSHGLMELGERWDTLLWLQLLQPPTPGSDTLL